MAEFPATLQNRMPELMLIVRMKRLTAVEEARKLFEGAKAWGLWEWLNEKKRARQTAEAAWEALDRYERKVQASWNEDILHGWRGLDTGRRTNHLDPAIWRALEDLKKSDAAAHKARMDAQARFEEADREMSALLARQGAQMALEAWTLREEFIRRMETLPDQSEPTAPTAPR
jgi:hypothetical protein